MVKAGIIGAAGYTGGELIRVLLGHPDVQIVFAQSTSHAGEPLWKAHSDLVGETDIKFSADAPVMDVDVVFLCGGHGNSKDTVASFPAGYKGAIIDLANDFRLKADAGDFVYGLTDAFKDRIQKARHIANPGCFATSIQLAVLPLAAIDKLGEVHVTAITGSTGAGQKLQETGHFSWRTNNISIYKFQPGVVRKDQLCARQGRLCPRYNGFRIYGVRPDRRRGRETVQGLLRKVSICHGGGFQS